MGIRDEIDLMKLLESTREKVEDNLVIEAILAILKKLKNEQKITTENYKSLLNTLEGIQDNLKKLNAIEVKDGITPVKGSDYFTPDEVQSITDTVVEKVKTFIPAPIKGEKGDRGESIKGDKGDPGSPGKDGITPTKGVDYFTKNEIESISRLIAKGLKQPIPEVDIEKIRIQIEDSIIGNAKQGGLTEARVLELISKYRRAARGIHSWGQIQGRITDQQDLVDYIATHGGGGNGAVSSVNEQTGDVLLDTSDIDPTTDRNYVTDAQLNVIQNTSGINTGDQDLSGYVLSSNLGDLAFLDSITASLVSDFDTEVSNNSDVAANTAARHVHTNFSLLETYTQTEANLADAVTKKHSHSNYSLLETYTQSNADLANAVSSAHVHSNYSLLETYTQTEVNLADAVSKRHNQNADTGTTSQTFQLQSGSSGIKIKNTSGVLEVRNSADSDYADIIVQNLTVKGTTTIINSETITLDDNIVVLNNNYSGSSPTENAGFEVERGTITNASLLWDESADKWKAGIVGSEVEISLLGHTHVASDITNFNTAVASTALLKANNLSDLANTTTARDNLGVEIGVDVQAYDLTLAALAAYNTNGILTQTAADTFTGRTITGTTDQITVTNGNGVSGNPTLSLPADVIIPTIITVPNTGLHVLDTDSSHDLIIKPGSNLLADRTFTLTTGDNNRTLNISAANVTIDTLGASLLALPTELQWRISLGLSIGGDVQAYDAALDDFAGLAQAADKLPYFDSTTTMATTTFTSFARSLVDDADAATARTTLGLVAGGTGDIWVEKAGDTMTGALVIDGSADNVQLTVQGHSTQTNFVALFEKSDGTDLAWINNSGRIFASTGSSAGFAIGATPSLSIVHDASNGTLANATGNFSISSPDGSTVIINSGNGTMITNIRGDTDTNLVNIGGATFDGVAIGTSVQANNKLYINASNAADVNFNGQQIVVTQSAAFSKTLRGLTVTASFSGTSGSHTGVNGLEFTVSATGNGGTISTAQGISAIFNVSTGAAITTGYIMRLFDGTGAGTIGTQVGLKIENMTKGSTNKAIQTGTGVVEFGDNLKLMTVGSGIYVKEGTNGTMGTGTLVGGTLTVNTTKVTANSRIFISHNVNGGTVGVLYISARSAGTSFTVTSTSGTDTSSFSWLIMEPA